MRLHSIAVLVVVVDFEHAVVVGLVGANSIKEDSSLDGGGSIALNFDQFNHVILIITGLVS